MKRVILLFCAFFSFTLPAAGADTPDGADLTRVLEEIRTASGGLETLSSDFLQEKHLAIFEETIASKGRFFFAQPDSLRWELVEPVASGFALQGEKGRRWHERSGEPESFDVDREPGMKMIADQLMAWARVDLDWLGRQYRMTLASESPIVLTLVPSAPGAQNYLDHIRIVFSADKRHVETVEIIEKGGDFTRILFSKTEINKPLDAGLFQGF